MVVDGQVKVFPPDPPALALACALAGDPMSGALEAAELLIWIWIHSPGRSRS